MHLGGARGRGVGRRAAGALPLGMALALAGAAGAQVELDPSIGDGPVPFDGTTWSIDERLGLYSGSNLFYSFSLFDVPADHTASFQLFDAAATKPSFVIARVTGGASEIGGRIESSHVGASLLLLNPSGFSFGPTSAVQVDGSFYVSTADVLRFAGGVSFDARSSEPPAVLSADPPEAFGFLGDAHAGIAFDLDRPGTPFDSPLPAEATFGVVAGAVSILGGSDSSGSEPTIRIEGGSIELAAARSAGTNVPLDVGSFDPESQPAEALVTLGQNAHLDVQSPLFSPVGAGRVVIRGGKLVVDDARITNIAAGDAAGSPFAIDIATSEEVTIDGGSQLTVTSLSQPAGDVRIASEIVTIAGATVFSETQGDAVGGAIQITADSISVAGGSVQTSSRATGVGGAIEITARELHVTDRGQIVSRPLARSGRPDPTSGPGGAIDVQVHEEVVLTGRGKIFSEATGMASTPGGNVTVHAGERILVVGEDAADADVTQISALTSSTSPDGLGGNLVVSAPTIELRDAGQIRTTTSGAARGGSLQVADTTELLRIVGNATVGVGRAGAGLFARVAPGASGAGGNLTVAARVVEVEDGGEISTRTLGAGNAGKLLIHEAERVSVRGGPRGESTLSARGAQGAGGELVIDLESVGGDLELASGGVVSASTVGTGNAGNLLVKADRISIRDAPSGLFAQSIQNDGNAGDVVVKVGSWLEVRNGGRISVESEAGRGDAGDVEIIGGPGATVALVGGEVSAESFGIGRAGNVTIDTGRDFVAGRGSSVATRAQGNTDGGQVAISAGHIFYVSDSPIVTDVDGPRSGSGSAGNLDAPSGDASRPALAVLNRRTIDANAGGDGNGGGVRVAANDLLASQGFEVDATSERGIAGTVNITGPDADLAGQIVPLPSNFFDAAKLMTAACDARRARAGSFVVQTRTAIPPLPDAPLSPPVLAPVAEGPGGADGAKCPG